MSLIAAQKPNASKNAMPKERQASPQPQANAAPVLELRAIALAALSAAVVARPNEDPHEIQFLHTFGQALPEAKWPAAVQSALTNPAPGDVLLVQLGTYLKLAPIELLTVALAAAVEEDPMVGRAVAYLQSTSSHRPTVGLCVHAFAPIVAPGQSPIHILATGSGLASGLLQRNEMDAPWPDQTLAIPLPILLALRGYDAPWPGTTLGLGATPSVPLPASLLALAHAHATALASTPNGVLVIRAGSPAESRNVAHAMAIALGKRALFLEHDKYDVPVPMLLLQNALPVICMELAPGDHKPCPRWPFYTGPMVVLAGPDGTVAAPGGLIAFVLPVPSLEERQVLWDIALQDHALAARLSQSHRQRAGRIAEIGRLARRHAAMRGDAKPTADDVLAAANGSDSSLGALAQCIPGTIGDGALILSDVLRRELRALLLRCRARDNLVDTLGPSA